MNPPPPSDPGAYDPFEDEPTQKPPGAFLFSSPLEGTQEGLTPHGREEVLKFAARENLPSDDPVFQLMALVRQNDLRGDERLKREEELFSQINDCLINAPAKLLDAVTSINVVAADHGRAVAESTKASDQALKAAEEGLKLAKLIDVREWVVAGVVGISLILCASMLLMGINTLNHAKQLMSVRQERDDLAIQVIGAAWERSLIVSEQAFLRGEFATLKAKDAQGELKDADVARVADIRARWDAVDAASKSLEQKEEQLRKKLKNL